MIKKLKQYKSWWNKKADDLVPEDILNNNAFVCNSFMVFLFNVCLALLFILVLIITFTTAIINPIIALILYIFTHKSEKINKAKVVKTIVYSIEDEIRVQGLLRFNDSGLLDFSTIWNKKYPSYIKDFFLINFNYTTVYVNTGHHQCNDGRRRSLGDIYRILKYYDSTLTYKELVALLDKEVRENKLSVSYCNQINKCVFTKDSTIINLNSRTEYYLKDGTNIKWNEIVNAFK